MYIPVCRWCVTLTLMVTMHPSHCGDHMLQCHLSPLSLLSLSFIIIDIAVTVICTRICCDMPDTLRPAVATLEVVVVGAADLKASDSNGKSDPFCVVKFANQEQATHHIPKTLNPKWNTKVRACLCI